MRKTITGSELRENIAMQELSLNIENQLKNINEIMQVGYEYEPGYFVLMLLIPKLNKLLREDQ